MGQIIFLEVMRLSAEQMLQFLMYKIVSSL